MDEIHRWNILHIDDIWMRYIDDIWMRYIDDI